MDEQTNTNTYKSRRQSQQDTHLHPITVHFQSERLNANIAGCYKIKLSCCCRLPQQLEHYECIKTVAFVIEKSIPHLLQWSLQPLCLSLCVKVLYELFLKDAAASNSSFGQ